MTKDEFISVYTKYKPDVISQWVYNHFSTKTTDNTKFKKIFTYSLIDLFLLLMIFAGLSTKFKTISLFKICTYVYMILLLSIGIIGLYYIIRNYIRVYKIRKDLNLTMSQFNYYKSLYGC
jgi:hypothetical protein